MLGIESKGALFLDIGCSTGVACRKLVADGVPVRQIIATDLNAGESCTSETECLIGLITSDSVLGHRLRCLQINSRVIPGDLPERERMRQVVPRPRRPYRRSCCVAYRHEFESNPFDMGTQNEGGYELFLYSPETWAAVWEEIFGVGNVQVETSLQTANTTKHSQLSINSAKRLDIMIWSVRRV